MSTLGPQTVMLAGPGWTDKREVRVGNISASWMVNGIGRFSGMIPVREAWRQGVDDYHDLYLVYRHPVMGYWVGIIKETRTRSGQVLEFSARSLVRKLRKTTTRRTYVQQRASAGALVFRALQDNGHERPLFDRIEFDDAGPLMSVEWHADDRFQIVDRLAKAAGMQYRVDFSSAWRTTFQFRQRVGEDKSGDVLLAEGVNVSDVEIVKSTDEIENKILAVSADDEWADAPFVRVADGASIAEHGLAQGTRRYSGVSSPGVLAGRALQELRDVSQPKIAITLRMSARDSILADIREGDRVRLWSESANARYLFDVERRALNDATGDVQVFGSGVAA